MVEDYYELLGVAREVGPPSFAARSEKLALKYHPDRAGVVQGRASLRR